MALADTEGSQVHTINTVNGQQLQIKEQDIICTTKDGVLHYLERPISPLKIPILCQTVIPSHHPLHSTHRFRNTLGNDKKISVIISRGSGSNLAEKFYNEVLLPLLNAVVLNIQLVEVYRTTSAESIRNWTRDIIAPAAHDGHEQGVIMLAGDGGVTDFVDAMYASLPPQSQPGPECYIQPILAILPFGTGNALFNSANPGHLSNYGLATLCRGPEEALPAFRVTLPLGSYAVDANGVRIEEDQSLEIDGIVVFSWALHSTLVADSDTPAYRAHGSARFGMAAKELLFPADGSEYHAFKGNLSLRKADSEDWEQVDRQTHAYVLLTFVSNLEALFCVSPDSKPLEGQMRLVHFGHGVGGVNGGQGVMKVMEAAYDRGKHIEIDAVGYDAVDGIKLEIREEEERWRRVCVDGRIFVVPEGGVVEVVKDERDYIVVDLMVLKE